MKKRRITLSLLFCSAMLFCSSTSAFGEGFGLYYIYFKNGTSMRCDAIWKDMGDYVWCGERQGSQGFPADEVDMDRTFQLQSNVSQLVDKSLRAFNQGDWDEAIRTATSALALDPRNEVAYTNRAGAYSNKAMQMEAIEDCNRAIEINPNFGLAYNNRGYARYRIGQLDEALTDYEMSCRLGSGIGCDNYERLKYVLELIRKE